MPMDVATKIALIKRLAGDIHGRLSASSAEDLNAQSACSEWDVGAVAAHLAGGAVRQKEAMVRGRAGEGGPPEGESVLPTPDQVQASNASTVQSRTAWGNDLLDDFSKNYGDLDEFLHGWSEWSIGCWHRRRGTITAESYVDLRIQELVIHDWDMRAGDTGAGELDPEGIVALLPASEMWYQLCFRPTAPLTTPAVYRFEIGGGADKATLEHDVVVTGDAYTVSERSPENQPELTIRADANTYLLCLYNRVDWNTAKRAGHVRVSQTADTIAHVSLRNLGRWFGGL